MTTKSKPYYWLECDGCGERSTEYGPYVAWDSAGSARDEAVDGEWQCDDEGDFCCECRRPLCAGCGEWNATTEHDDETWCDFCLAEEVAS